MVSKKALEFAELFVKYKSSRSKWEKRAWEYEMVYNNDVDGTGTQFDDTQLQELREKHGIPLSINIIVAIIEQMIAFITASEPSISVVPIGESSKDIAYIYREIINAVLSNSKFHSKLEYALRDQLVIGHGILMIQPNNFFSYNNFNVNIRYVPWSTFYPDPNSKEPDYQDSEYIFLSIPLTKSKAKKIYNLTDEQMAQADTYTENSHLDTEWKNSLGMMGYSTTKDEFIWVQEIYEKVRATLYILQDGTKTFTRPEGTYVDQDGNLQDMVQAEVNETFVKKYIKVGHLIIYEEILPLTYYPFVIYVHTHNRTPYPYSLLHHVVDVQHALNNALQLTLLNAQRGSNYGMIGFEGTVPDKKKFIEQGSEPGAIQEIVPDPTLPNAGLPTLRPPVPLNQAWYTLLEKLISLIEYITGIFDLMQGNPINAPETAQATTSLQNFGSQRVRMHARRIDYSNQILGQAIIEFFQHFAPPENVIRYLNNTEAMVEIRTNIQLREAAQQIQQQAMQQQQLSEGTEEDQTLPFSQQNPQEELSSQIPPPQLQQTPPLPSNSPALPYEQVDFGGQTGSVIYDEATEKVKFILGDIREGKYLVRFQSAQSLPTTQQMVLNFLANLMSRMSNDSTGVAVLKMMLKLVNYPETDKLFREIEQNTNLQTQLQQIIQELEESQSEIKRLTRINHNLMQQNELLKIREELVEAKYDAEVKFEKFKNKVEKDGSKPKPKSTANK